MISKIIRLFDKGVYSHVAIAISDTMILEAQYFTRSRIVENYHIDYDIVSIDRVGGNEERIISLANSLVGKWYDYRQVIGYVLKKPWNNPNNMICSELVAVLLYELGVNNTMDLEEFSMMTPNELYSYLTKK